MKSTLYIELYEKLKKQIIEGQFNANDKFYSKRQLGNHLSVSQTTIEHAYHLLQDEGYIYSKPRSGYFVSDIESLPVLNNYNYEKLSVADSINENNSSTENEYSFKLAQIDTKYFPIDLFRKYSKEVFDANNLIFLQRGDIQGEVELRQQISQYLFNSRGVTCHPNQIIIGSSTEQLLNLLVTLLNDSSFIIEKPSYPPIKFVLDKQHVSYDQIKVEKNGINIDEVIKSNKNIVYITPSHQFPTGFIMDLKKRTQLINWAQENENRYIIEDDYDSEFRYYGKPIPALQSLDSKEKVIYISTFSKSIFPSCRIAYLVLPSKLLHRYYNQQHKETNTVPVHMQKIVSLFMESGSFNRHLNRMRKVYRNKLSFILNELKPYKDQLTIEGAETGMHFNITVTNGLTLKECLDRASTEKLELQVYNYEEIDDYNKSPKFILGFGGINEDKLKAHTDALIRALII
ncbi:PLP-dependent aminotransferase family protein [Staphylococcus simiae]|uniref:MocR-like pyridoxine biosynthesis transcription factor PdxR n=1 Tax=Staphylococcus simiae TaxID=308354 RepID=UPI001A977B5C|nr:PLP-dependent aminotransferase family protein [Staphylococcus simiae]MBO1199462.1 PLP-dependent aminotransferase family protein [Staphylococcus simiae]MBO1201766.1 PLP-dependent aminotransferase family protein [Staphylococcus simiae]MBO1203941.1 PLP-dependent aminotransferase family protein [Staphylococcus simiae]MBO1211419.1 PLP-dependent aminotransferase family protein [Staphylococcus simiae]MBO1230173.1 PLP-dependent aminotransferase family protein [Staphylococcus simiae]